MRHSWDRYSLSFATTVNGPTRGDMADDLGDEPVCVPAPSWAGDA